ncbi:hypothetical protein MRB53_013944 [Persea americana]|uniref:Uncharacterized protein n=1 Tax=Persea americana TaxID=3435 RepID=A0ACC2KA23_PERAE|nr:hypothetical protein MRB53_013944 [Persea americana]
MKGSIAKEPLARQLCVDDDKEADADVGVRPHTHTQRRGVLPVVAKKGDVPVPSYQQKEVIGFLKTKMKRRGV